MKNNKPIFLLLIWFLAVTSFIIEKYYLNDYIDLKKLQDYTLSASETVNDINKKLSGLISSGSLNYLLWMEGHMSDELSVVKSIHPLIQDVLIYNSGFHLLAGTTDKLAGRDITTLLEESASGKKSASYIRQEGILFIYPVFNGRENKLKGLISVILKYPFYLKGGSIFVMDVTRGSFFLNSAGYLNNEDLTGLQKYLQHITLGRQGHTLMEMSTGYELFWNYSEQENVYIGFIRNAKPLYAFMFPYVGALCILLSLLIWRTGLRQRPDKHEIYEKIINDNIKTLAEMKKGIELLFQNTGDKNILSVETTISSIVNEISEPVPAYYYRPDKEAREPMISDFILLDPLDVKWYKPYKKKSEFSELVRGIRPGKEAFSAELMSLMNEVSRKERGDKNQISENTQQYKEPEIQAVPKDFRSIEKDPFAVALENLYATNEPGEELDIVVEYIRNFANADGLAVMFFERDLGCYTIDITSGLESSWARHFYLLPKDSILSCPGDQTNNIVVDEALLQNSFFRKRIPPEYLNRIGALKLVPLKSGEILIIVALFYWRDGRFLNEDSSIPNEKLKALDSVKFSDQFQEILPVLIRIFIQKQRENIHVEESYRDIYNILKSFTVLSDQQANIVHIVSDRLVEDVVKNKIREFCRISFKNHERYIINNPNHFIFFLNQTTPEIIEQFILEFDGKAQIRTLKYPELGKNLFAYL